MQDAQITFPGYAHYDIAAVMIFAYFSTTVSTHVPNYDACVAGLSNIVCQ